MSNTVSWRKRLLIPCWVFQLAFAALFVVIAVSGVVVINANEDTINSDLEVEGSFTAGQSTGILGAARAGLAVIIALCGVSLICTFIEMVALCSHRLNPAWFLASNSLKTAIWATFLILSLIRLGSSGSIFGLIILIVAFLASLFPLIYNSIKVHRQRMERKTRGAYNVAGGMRVVSPQPQEYNNLRADLIAESHRSRASSINEPGSMPLPPSHLNKPLPEQHYGYRGNDFEMA